MFLEILVQKSLEDGEMTARVMLGVASLPKRIFLNTREITSVKNT
jgi:hypothetical protein